MLLSSPCWQPSLWRQFSSSTFLSSPTIRYSSSLCNRPPALFTSNSRKICKRFFKGLLAVNPPEVSASWRKSPSTQKTVFARIACTPPKSSLVASWYPPPRAWARRSSSDSCLTKLILCLDHPCSDLPMPCCSYLLPLCLWYHLLLLLLPAVVWLLVISLSTARTANQLEHGPYRSSL